MIRSDPVKCTLLTEAGRQVITSEGKKVTLGTAGRGRPSPFKSPAPRSLMWSIPIGAIGGAESRGIKLATFNKGLLLLYRFYLNRSEWQYGLL